MSNFRKGPQQPDEQGGHLLKTSRKTMLRSHGGLETIRKTMVKKIQICEMLSKLIKYGANFDECVNFA